MSNFLEQLGFKKKTHVGISISSNNFIELVCLDKQTGAIINYASGNVKYNTAIREIIDYDEFEEVVVGLFEEAGLSPQECSVSITLPNVHFGITPIEESSESSYLLDNLQTEIEDLYIFKRNEPIIAYTINNNSRNKREKNIIYGAIQQKVIVKILDIFENLQCDVIKIESSYNSLLNAVQCCDRFSSLFEPHQNTLLVLVTANSCCTFYIEDSTLFDYFEEPIAVKSFSTEEVYSTISKVVENSMTRNNPDNLLIISETDEINAEVLARSFDFQGNVDCLNKSISYNEQFIDTSLLDIDVDSDMVSYITIESVGVALSSLGNCFLDINFLPEEKKKNNIVEVCGYEIDFNRLVVLVLRVSVLSGLIVGMCGKFIFSAQANGLKNKNTSNNQQIEVFKRQTQEIEADVTKDLFPILKKIEDSNLETVNVFTALSQVIPENIYIKKFVKNPNGGIGILGEANNGDSVNDFVKGLRATNEDLILQKLAVKTSEDFLSENNTPRAYVFEIKTKSQDVYLDAVEESLSGFSNNQDYEENNDGSNSANNINRGDRGALTPPPPVI